ncbi:MAG: hypothetical protein CXT70_04665 [Methanobacteriota archaeon]|nr:MAG: hypothetical protein CXT70_04665 [Euryarchaeota archaeon]
MGDEENRLFQKGLHIGQTMRKVLALSFVVLLLVSSLPTVSACETEAARIANGQLPRTKMIQFVKPFVFRKLDKLLLELSCGWC